MKITNYFDGKVKLIERQEYEDDRGLFIQNYDNTVQEIIQNNIVQENISFSKKNTIRGLHYQWNQPMGKLVQCINGNIIDIIVDIRKNSHTLGKVLFFELNKPNILLWIPHGFAHGFVSQTENVIVKYLCTSLYNKDGEGAINVKDKKLNIIDNLKIDIDKLIISVKDNNAQTFEDYLNNPKF